MYAYSPESAVGFVGIGTIGFQIAENLVTSDVPVVAFDVREEALEEFEAVGGETAADCREVGERCPSVHVVVANDAQAKDVAYGAGDDDGLFEGFRANDAEETLVVVHSTLVPDTVVELSENAPEGVTVVDAPVSNTDGDNPRTGGLTVMLGGDTDVLEGYRPVWDTIAAEVMHLGPLGSGLAAKLVNNAIHHSAEVATFEALQLGAEYGIDEEKLLEVFRNSSGNTYFVQNFEYFTRDVLLEQPDNPRWFAYNVRKNLTQVLKLSDTVDVDVPLMGHVSQEAPRWFKEIADDLETE